MNVCSKCNCKLAHIYDGVELDIYFNVIDNNIWCPDRYFHIPMTNLEYLEYQYTVKELQKFYAQ